MTRPTQRRLAAWLLAGCAGGLPGVALPRVAWADGALDRAHEAQARGDLRGAQIELRNAVRDAPDRPALRLDLASASLDLGDGLTAEKEARAALERGADPVAATRLLLRALVAQNRAGDLLRDFPAPTDGSGALAGQVSAARALAQLMLGRPDDAATEVAAAQRQAPAAPEPFLAAAALAVARGDRAAANTATDTALRLAPDDAEALLRKGDLLADAGDLHGAALRYGQVLARRPGSVPARLKRAEILLRSNDDAAARADVDAALTTVPASAPGIFLRALLLVRARDWAGADAALQRIGNRLGDYPDGFLLLTLAKQGLGQAEQAVDAARRAVVRKPEDPRGVNLLAQLEHAAGRPGSAIPALLRLTDSGKADAQSFVLLGRAQAAIGHPNEAAAALARAGQLAPGDATVQAQLAAARLASGDAGGAQDAARRALVLNPTLPGAEALLATAAFLMGDPDAASASLAHLNEAERRTEAAGLLDGNLRLMALDTAGARAAFGQVLTAHPDSVAARNGLARVAQSEGRLDESQRLFGEALQRDGTNAEALAGLMRVALSGGASGQHALATLLAAQVTQPANVPMALAASDILLRTGQAAQALALLQNDALKPGTGAGAARLPMARASTLAALGRWSDARDASRLALATNPTSVPARIQYAMLLAREDLPAAEAQAREGLRLRPDEPALQRLLVSLVGQARGPDAALAEADRLAKQPTALPAAALLRGDVLLAQNRTADALRAYAAAADQAPSSALAVRRAAVLRDAGQADNAAAVLRGWLERHPNDSDALAALAALDIAAGRFAAAEQGLTTVLATNPNDPVPLNNMAWLVQRRGNDPSRARTLAERAFFMAPNTDTADTLGWILAQQGNSGSALPLLRQAAASAQAGAATPDSRATLAFHLAMTLRDTGDRAGALGVLAPVLAANTAFPDRPAAEQLLAQLRGGTAQAEGTRQP